MMNAKRSKPQSGFTLVEVLVSAALIGVALMASTWTMSATTQAKAMIGSPSVTASLIAGEINAMACTLPKAPSGSVGATSAGGVLALDSLEGAVFSPPLKADGSSWTQYSGWSQTVDLAVFDVTDLSTPTAADPTSGLSEDGTQIYRLTVLVHEGDELAGTYQWWISP